MRKQPDWDDGDYMEWADQERLVRMELAEIRERDMRKRKAENYRAIEQEEKNGRISITGQTESGNDRVKF